MNLVRKGFFLKRKLTELEQKVEMKHESEADENHRELTIQVGCLRQQVMEMSEILAQKGLELDQFSEKVARNRSIDELIQQELVLKQRLSELSQHEQSQKIMIEQLETEIRKTVEKWKKCFAELELEWKRKNEEIGNREKELERLKLEINELSLLKQNLDQSNQQQQKQPSYSPPSSTFPVQYSQFVDSSIYSSQYPPPINICQYPSQFPAMQHSQFNQLSEPFHQPQFQPQQIRSYYNQQKLHRQRMLVQEELNRRAAVTINQHTNQINGNFGYRDSLARQSFAFQQYTNQQPESEQSTTIDKSEIFFTPLATSLFHSKEINIEYSASSSSPIAPTYSLVQSSTITSTPEISNFDKSISSDCNPIANPFSVEEIQKQNCIQKIKVEQEISIEESTAPTTDDQDAEKSTEILVSNKISTIKEEIVEDSSEIQIA